MSKNTRSRLALLVALFMLAGLVGCPRQGAGPDIRPADLTGSAKDSYDLFQAAGDRALLVLKLRPDQWPRAVETLRPYLAGLPVPPGSLDKLLAAPDLIAAAAELMALAEGQKDWPHQLDGWDQSRPVVAALFEAGQEGVSLAGQAASREPGYRLPGMRHRVLIPATEPKTMLLAMMNFMGSLGVTPEARASGFGGLRGGALYPFPDWRGFAALIPEDRHLRIELVTHQIRTVPPREGEDVQATLLEGWRTLLEKNPRAQKLPFTPALHFAATSDEMLLAYLRPWRFREVSNMLGSRLVLEAVAYADPAMRATLMAMGFAEVNIGTLIMSPVGAEMDDLALGFSADGVFRFRGVASLTELGARMYQAGYQGAQSPVSRTDIPALMRASFRLDANALLKNAQNPEFFSGIKSPRELIEPYQECGYFCPLHALLRNPVANLKMLRSFARFDTVEHLPLSAEVTLVDLNPMNPGQPVKAAAAVSLPAAYNPTWIKQALATLEQERHTGGKIKTHLVIKEVQDQKILLIGLNLHPEEAFTVGKQVRSPQAVVEFTMDLDSLSAMFAPINPVAAKVLKQISSVDGHTRLSGRALVGEVRIGPQPGKPDKSASAQVAADRDYSGFRWASPGLAEAGSKGSACLRKLVSGMIQAYKAVGAVAPGHKARLLGQALEELNQELDCALKEPGTKGAAGEIHLMTVFLQDYLYENLFARDQHLAALTRACARGLDFACRREKEVEATEELVLAGIPGRCGESMALGPGRVVIRASGQAQPEVSVPPYARSVGLLVEQGVAWSRVSTALAGLKDKNIESLDVLVRDSEKRAITLPVRLPGSTDDMIEKFSDAGAWLELKLGGSEIEIGSGTDKRSIAGKPEGPDLDKLRKELDSLRKTYDPGRLYMAASDQTPFASLAAVLSILACTPDGYPDRSFQVVLGPAPSRPEPESVLGVLKPQVMGSLDKNIIRRVIRRHIKKIQYCYEKELARDPKLRGTIQVRFTISAQGEVIQAKAQKDTMQSKNVTQCLLARVRQMKFPKPKGGGIVVVNYPFLFKSTQ